MKNDWRDLRVLVAGCGSIGKRHARVLGELGLRDVWACDPVPAQRDSMAGAIPAVRLFESFEAGLRDKPDAVVIGTPPRLHIPMAIEALRAGCHVLCEKPLSDTLEGVDELDRAIRETGLKFMVALCFRFHEGHRRAKALLDSGCAGRLVSVRALVGEHLPDVRPDYRDLFSSKTSGAFDLMHEVDLALWYAGTPVRRVACLSGSYSEIGIEAPDVAEILMDFEDRRIASVHLDFFQRPRRRLTELICTRGVITVEFARWDHCTLSWYEGGEWSLDEFTTDRDDMFRAEDREFLESVASDRPIRCDLAEGRKSVEVVVRAQSAHSAF